MSRKSKRYPPRRLVEVQRAEPSTRPMNQLKVSVKIALAEAELERRFRKANENSAPKN